MADITGMTPEDAEPGSLDEIIAQGRDFEIVELDKSGHPLHKWLHAKNGQVSQIAHQKYADTSAFQVFRDCFLPAGFPHSVSEDYLAYQFFDSLQAFFSTIISLLASRALLQGLGVGDASSSTTFAVFLTILKDAMSRIATVVFAYKFGLRIEPDAKRYRFLADLFNDTAFFLELYSPHFGPWGKVAALSAGEALRALCSVAAGASKAALSVHFAKHDNLSELNAKEASQETAVGLIGLLAASLVIRHIGDQGSVLALTIVLVFAHLLTNYLGVRSVCMKTLNRQRATILFTEYLRVGAVLTPAEVARRESIVLWDPVVRDCNGRLSARVEFADSYGDAVDRRVRDHDLVILDGRMHTKFICRTSRHSRLPCIKMLLWKGAQATDAIRAWFGAMEIAWALGEDDSSFQARLAQLEVQQRSKAKKLEAEVRSSHPYLWRTMIDKGWNLQTQGLETASPVRLDVQGALANQKRS